MVTRVQKKENILKKLKVLLIEHNMTKTMKNLPTKLLGPISGKECKIAITALPAMKLKSI
jgi:hypothetical protein